MTIKNVMPLKKIQHCCLAAALCLTPLFALQANAGDAIWALNNANSNIAFVSIKQNSIGETHHFKTLTGQLDKTGQLTVAIDLSSVATGVDIRDTRMQEFLFETNKFATATITADVSPIAYGKLKKGQSLMVNTPFTLDLHGVKKVINADVIITLQADKTLSVVSSKPILLQAQDFGLDGGIAKLMELAGLKAIASSVPVTFNLSLNIDKK
jgi:polyisoprenoid-binding protein YceI